MSTALSDFYLSNSSLRWIYVYIAAFGESFNTLIAGDIIMDPIDIVESYIGDTWALLGRQIRDGSNRDSIKTSIALNCFFNEKSGDVYSHYVKTEKPTIHLHLQRVEGVFLDGVDSIVTTIDN